MLSASSASLAEPLEILNQTTQTFADARATDPLQVVSLGEKLHKLEEQRRKFQTDAQDKVRALTYRLELARARSLRPVTAPSPEQHAELVARLKGELLAAEQRVEDQEQLVSEAEERLNKANEEEEGIRMAREEEENKGGDVVDPVVLKLEMYRSLGLELFAAEPDSTTTATSIDSEISFSRALVKGAAGIQHVDLVQAEGPQQEYFMVNQMWSFMD